MIRRFGRPGLIGLAARTAVVAGTATAVSGGMRRYSQNREQERAEAEQYEAQQQIATQPAAPPPPPPPAAASATTSPSTALLDQLQQLASLHDAGALSDAEFSAAKAHLLG